MSSDGPGWNGTGQRVVVTGASSGIGAEAAVEAARAGATVALVARRADRLHEVLERCREHVPWCQAVVADLAELELIDDVAAELTAVLGGGVDVLINNAGVPKRRGVRDLTAADVEEVMAINYFSLRQTDAEKALLAATTEGYELVLQITQNRFDAGIAAKSDLLQAQTQLANARIDARSLPSTPG